MLGHEGLVVICVLLQPIHKRVPFAAPECGCGTKATPGECVVLEECEQPAPGASAQGERILHGEDLG